jgi:hypothetical protein
LAFILAARSKPDGGGCLAAMHNSKVMHRKIDFDLMMVF